LLSTNKKIKIYRIIILPVVLCETWSLTLRKEHRLRVFENRVLSRVFGPKRDEVTGEWRRLHNKKIYDLYSSQNIIWGDQSNKNEMDGACSTYGRQERIIQVLVGRPKGKRPLGRLRRRWEDNIKMDFQYVEWGHGLDSSGLG
jgi:hypothetical protein